jgi:hypothetical protein
MIVLFDVAPPAGVIAAMALIVIFGLLLFVIVIGLVIYSIYRKRKTKNRLAPATVQEGTGARGAS